MTQSLSKQQLDSLRIEQRRAAISAIRRHFTGQGCATRTINFSMDVLLTASVWFFKAVALSGLLLLVAIYFGEGVESSLKTLHNWMASTPYPEVRQFVLVEMTMYLNLAVAASLCMALGLRLTDIAMPAVRVAAKKFKEKLL